MNLNHSLKQAWMIIILVAVVLPTISIMIWYGVTIYNDKMSAALSIKHHENAFIAHKIESKIQHLKTVLDNKSDAIAIQLEDSKNPNSLMQLNLLLKKIMQRDELIHEILLLSDNMEIISIIEPDIGILGDELLPASQLEAIKKQKGLNMANHKPEVIVPFHGKTYIGVPVEDEEIDSYIFSISVPIWINSEVKAVLIAYMQVNAIWSIDELDDYGNKKSVETIDYILSHNDTLIAVDKLFEHEKGIKQKIFAVHSFDFMDDENVSYIGLSNELVFGTATLIPSLNWTLVSEIKVSLITQSIIAALTKLFIWTLLGILIVMKIVLVLVNRTLEPIQKVCHVANQVANGNYDSTLNSTGIFELDKLNKDVMHMAEQRQKAEINLKEKYQLQVKEREHREMLDTMVVAVLTIDSAGLVLSSNKAAEQLFGYSAKQFLMMGINELMPDSIANKHDKYLEAYEKTGQSHIIGVGRDLFGKKKNGKLFPMRILIAELPLNAEGKRRFIGSCIDLTEFRKREEQIQRTQKMEALGKLTGGIAHDFNNMLGVIIGYTQLLSLSLKKYQDQKVNNYVGEIKKAGERGASLTQKLMAFTQQKQSKAVCIDINKLLLDESDMLKKSLTIRIDLVLELADNIWLIKVGKSGLQDCILNIVINAVYAMKEIKTPAQLTISTNNKSLTQIESENLNLKLGEYIEISFLDTGTGIDASLIEKIFDPFYTSKGREGTGLGLSQVYTFIKKHDGGIEVNSELGLGTQFTFYFPRYIDENIKQQLKVEHNLIELRGNETILIVDDELAELTQELLERQGYNVFCVSRGKKALEILENHPIDLMLSDIIMPEMDGYQLASIVQQKYPNVKIQLISGYNDQSNLNLVNKKLSDNLLPKPFDSITLFKAIRDLLDSKNEMVLNNDEIIDEQVQVQHLEWQDSFNTGIREVDEEHKQLLNIINTCIDMKNKIAPKETGKKLLQQLLDTSEEHFLNEEKLLENSNYPYLHKHKMVHKLFIQRIRQFLKEYEVDTLGVDSLLKFLIDWQEHHIMGMDKEALSYSMNTKPESQGDPDV